MQQQLLELALQAVPEVSGLDFRATGMATRTSPRCSPSGVEPPGNDSTWVGTSRPRSRPLIARTSSLPARRTPKLTAPGASSAGRGRSQLSSSCSSDTDRLRGVLQGDLARRAHCRSVARLLLVQRLPAGAIVGTDDLGDERMPYDVALRELHELDPFDPRQDRHRLDEPGARVRREVDLGACPRSRPPSIGSRRASATSSSVPTSCSEPRRE